MPAILLIGLTGVSVYVIYYNGYNICPTKYCFCF